MGERYDRRHQGHGVRIIVHRLDEGPVDLERLDRQLGEVGERRVSRAEVVDRHVDAQPAHAWSFSMLASMLSISRLSVISRSMPVGARPSMIASSTRLTKLR